MQFKNVMDTMKNDDYDVVPRLSLNFTQMTNRNTLRQTQAFNNVEMMNSSKGRETCKTQGSKGTESDGSPMHGREKGRVREVAETMLWFSIKAGLFTLLAVLITFLCFRRLNERNYKSKDNSWERPLL
jgi:hypothetical protein